jgi:hypothetical protein
MPANRRGNPDARRMFRHETFAASADFLICATILDPPNTAYERIGVNCPRRWNSISTCTASSRVGTRTIAGIIPVGFPSAST